MRTITIEVEGKHEDRIIEELSQAARTAARNAGGTYVLLSLDAPAGGRSADGEIKVPSFMRQGKRERMGVVW